MMQRRFEGQAAAHNARLSERLKAETVVGGIAFPPGTQVLWMEDAHQSLVEARMPRPADVLGTMAVYARRDGEGWYVETNRPQVIGGWPCDKGEVRLGGDGSLGTCTLSRQTEWKGWTLPAQTRVNLHGWADVLSVALPQGAWVFAREIGRPLPTAPEFNPDGSLSSVTFGEEDALVLHGVALCRVVRWRYDPSTFGLGRDRPPVAVVGEGVAATDKDGIPSCRNEDLVIRLPDGAVTRE